MFGHVKGAFTGAAIYKKGVFESAGKGTIFLDEFGEISSSMQVRLLRVLQEHKIRPVGSEDSKEINFNARVVVATNRDLKREVAEGRFRQDLYYRVNVFPIRSPALRDRLDDLPLLIDVLLNRLDSTKLVRPLRFDSEALAILQNYSWPGNVRELENLIERMAINPPGTGFVSAADISLALELNGSGESDESREIILSKGLNCLRNSRATTVRRMHKRQELDFYLTELAHVGGNVTKAARRLGINRSTLHMRIKRLEMKLASPSQAE